QRGKWDFTVLPFKPQLKGAPACGDYARARVRFYMDEELQKNAVIKQGQMIPATSYIVQPNDTLWGISRKFKVSVSDLMQWNGLRSSIININQVLTVVEPTYKP